MNELHLECKHMYRVPQTVSGFKLRTEYRVHTAADQPSFLGSDAGPKSN